MASRSSGLATHFSITASTSALDVWAIIRSTFSKDMAVLPALRPWRCSFRRLRRAASILHSGVFPIVPCGIPVATDISRSVARGCFFRWAFTYWLAAPTVHERLRVGSPTALLSAASPAANLAGSNVRAFTASKTRNAVGEPLTVPSGSMRRFKVCSTAAESTCTPAMACSILLAGSVVSPRNAAANSAVVSLRVAGGLAWGLFFRAMQIPIGFATSVSPPRRQWIGSIARHGGRQGADRPIMRHPTNAESLPCKKRKRYLFGLRRVSFL